MRRFLADASHELRTPLTAIRGTAQVLLRSDELEREEVEGALSAIHGETIRLSHLVDDLLQLSRLDAGQSLHPHPVPVSRFLRDFVTRYATAWPGRTIEVETQGLDGEQAHVDPDALTRVLTNLVDNAARYSTPGRPITIAGKPQGHEVRILVRDEGPGLPSEEAQHVFERFYRGSKSRSRQSGGSGLGLAIVQALVQQSSGAIRLDTAPDHGTTVEFSLPLVNHGGTD
jgi:two-component system OmpR family sensor kinase